MSPITTDCGVVHYEVNGHEKLFILLHGWLGSLGLWVKTMEHLSLFCRPYDLGFWGCGKSGRNISTYFVDIYADMVEQFIEHLGMPSCSLIGMIYRDLIKNDSRILLI